MIKLKDLLLENDDIFIPRRIEDRQTKYNNITQKEVNAIVDDFIEAHHEHIKDVALVGGEPLLLPENERLLYVIPEDWTVTIITK